MAAARRRLDTHSGDQAGAVLVLVLVLVAAMAVVALQTVRGAQVELLAAGIERNRRQADELLDSGVLLAGVLLTQDARADAAKKEPADHMQERWALYFGGKPVELGAGSFTATILPVGSRLPVNAVAGKVNARKALERLLRTRGGMGEERSAALVMAIVDFIDADGTGDHEASTYYAAGLKHAPPNRPLLALDELRLVKGMPKRTFEALRPFLSAHGSMVNINFAPVPVLAALVPHDVDYGTARALARDMVAFRRDPANADALRKPGWYMTELEGFDDVRLYPDMTGVSSREFSVEVDASAGAVQRHAWAVLSRYEDPKDKEDTRYRFRVLSMERR